MLCSARWPPCRPGPRSPRRRAGPSRSCVRRRTKRRRVEKRLLTFSVPVACDRPDDKERHRILINSLVSATTPAGSVVHKVFHRPRLKAEKSPRRASCLCSVASRLAGACANPDPPQGFRYGRRGSMSLHGPKLTTERAPSTERGSMSLRLIRQAVGLLHSDQRRR